MVAFPFLISVRGVECDNYWPTIRVVATDSTGYGAEKR
jgi:hypothetical protein